MKTRIVTPSTEQIIDVNYLANYISNNELSNDDNIKILNDMINAAQKAVEKKIDISLVSKVYREYYESGEIIDNLIQLGKPPHSTVGSVIREDFQGTKTTLTLNTDYYVRGETYKMVELVSTLTSSVVVTGGINADDNYIIEFTSGYGIIGANATEALPQDLKLGIAQQVAEWWVNRSNFNPNLISNSQLLDIINTHEWRGWV